jgi:fructuronate reductase
LDPNALSIGIVHLGLGAFHRAHQVAYTEAACQKTGETRWGICAASERSPVAAEMLASQDGLYSLLVANDEDHELRVMASLRGALFARRDADALVAQIADSAVEVVTLTVTEKGYRHDQGTRKLRRDDPELDADASGRKAVSVVGQLCRALEERRRKDAGPLTIMSCDNLSSNGGLLHGLVDELFSWPSARFDEGLAQWVAENVTFPCSMVDRIVPATTDAFRTEAERQLGVTDRAVVVTEPFMQWVIEDRFAQGRPAWDRAGAELVEDVGPYETLKLRVLNGSHSALAYLGLLAGIETIDEVSKLPTFEAFVHKLVDEEVRPTLTLPEAVDLDIYHEQVLKRFANTALPYRCTQVAADGSQKLPERLFGVIRECLIVGAAPYCATLVVAAWLRALLVGVDDLGRRFELSDPMSTQIKEAIGDTEDEARVVDRALQISEVFGPDLCASERFKAMLTDALFQLSKGRITDVLAAVTQQSARRSPR